MSRDSKDIASFYTCNISGLDICECDRMDVCARVER